MSDSDPTQPLSDSRERAAFHVSIHSSKAAGQTIWETRAYHEESDTAVVWPGPPGQDLLRWLCTIAGLPGKAAPTSADEPAAPPARDETTAPAPAAPGPNGQAPATKHGKASGAGEPGPQGQPGAAGPVDDFTQIIGISAATERQLHAAGIRTYAQLAERTPAELGALLALPPERISRRGWITRARALARLASLPSAQPTPAPAPPPEEEALPVGQPNTALWVEVLFDDEGAILEQRLLREGEPPAPEPRHDEAQVARFFVEAPPSGSPGALPLELVCELEDLELEEIPGSGPDSPPRLRARSTLRVAGLGAGHARRERAVYQAYMLAHELATGATAVLQAATARLSADEAADLITLECQLPEVGRYQMLLVVLLADGAAISSVAGPRLRVNP